MKTKNYPLVNLTMAAIIAAMYTVMTLFIPAPAYNIAQFRVSEMLTILPIFTTAAIPGLAVGCAISNLVGIAVNPAGAWDILIGSLTTLAAAGLTYRLRNVKWFNLPIAATIPPVLLNAVIIGAELTLAIYTPPYSVSQFLINMCWVGGGQLLACTVCGLIFYSALERLNVRQCLPSLNNT